MTTHAILPDVQMKPGVNTQYLENIGKYLADKKPDVIVCIGDFADMPSLSSYDVGTKAFEGRSYVADIQAAKEGIAALMEPIIEEQSRLKRNKEKQWKPRLIMTLGNHENRINRAINSDRKLSGLISTDDLHYEDYGFEVFPFLEVVVVDGIAYSHYFTSGVLGRPVSSAAALLTKKHMSAVMGHVQHRGIAYSQRADGKQITGLFCGSCYEHDEDYLGAQGNTYWRGIWMLYNIDDGSFDEQPIPLSYINNKYGKTAGL